MPDDNPYSEAQFKTLKYRPDYPQRFGGSADARAWAQAFFAWYNQEYHHTGLGLLTPAVVHHGQAETALSKAATGFGCSLCRPSGTVRETPASAGSTARGGVD